MAYFSFLGSLFFRPEGLRWVAVLAVGLLSCPALGLADNYGPKWQVFSSPTLGVSLEVTADTHVSYGLSFEKLVTIQVMERARPGPKINERGSRFNFSTIDLGDSRITDPDGLLRNQAAALLDNRRMNNFKVVKNETFTFQGLRAREVIFSFTTDYFHTPATHRYLLVAGNNRFYKFNWVWSDAGPVPDDAKRIQNSIRFSTPTTDANARSRAMLEDVITYYWLYEPIPDKIHFTPALRAIADSKRARESKIIEGYGYIQRVNFLGWEKDSRVFRVEHDSAVVDWYIADNGNQISGLTWKKVRDL